MFYIYIVHTSKFSPEFLERVLGLFVSHFAVIRLFRIFRIVLFRFFSTIRKLIRVVQCPSKLHRSVPFFTGPRFFFLKCHTVLIYISYPTLVCDLFLGTGGTFVVPEAVKICRHVSKKYADSILLSTHLTRHKQDRR